MKFYLRTIKSIILTYGKYVEKYLFMNLPICIKNAPEFKMKFKVKINIGDLLG